MKNLFIIAALCLLVSCKQEQPPKDYAVVHGTITNPKKDLSLRLYDPVSSKSKVIKVDDDGNFRDTLKLEKPIYYTAVYENVFNLYLKNDMDVKVDFDGNEIAKSITFSGDGKAENDFLKYKAKRNRELMGENYKDYLSLDDAAFNTKTDGYAKDLQDKMDAKSELDSSFVVSETKSLNDFKESIQAQHQEQLEINEALGAGNMSPQFSDYINYKGGTSSLADFKGKYTYIDVWATWCVPCVYEMPFMNKIEKEYEGNDNIQFIGLSIDRQADEDKWRKMIVNKELMGSQLLADNEIDSQFIRDYYIYGIPRFILLDPEGKIVTYDAPRPSELKLKELFDSLNI